MHIVIVDTTLTTPPTGGAQTFLVNLAESLAGNHRLSVITQPGPETSIVSALRSAGAEVLLTLWTPSHLPEERARRLAEWVHQNDADAYIISISPEVGWLALPLLDPALPTLSIAHNDVPAFYEPLKHYYHFMDCAIGVSETIRRKIVADCGVPSERAGYVPYGVRSLAPEQVEQLVPRPAGQALKICYVGRLVQDQKRVLDFVPLAAELVKRGVAFELSLIGDGKERALLEARLRDRGLDKQVTFCGWLKPEIIAAMLPEQDVFVLLSDHEGLPVALIEAMGHALVPVVTDIESGNTQLVRNGENGFVVPVGDINLAAARIQQLASSGDSLNRMKKEAWQTGHQFSVAQMVAGYLSCIEVARKGVKSRNKRAGVPDPYPMMPSCRSKYPLWLRKLKARLLHLRTGSGFPGTALR